MDLWLEAEIRVRRGDILENARRSRLSGLVESGRSTGLRIRVADSAQAMSDSLAALARSLRNGEAA